MLRRLNNKPPVTINVPNQKILIKKTTAAIKAVTPLFHAPWVVAVI
jgi:hypothetical protein